MVPGCNWFVPWWVYSETAVPGPCMVLTVPTDTLLKNSVSRLTAYKGKKALNIILATQVICMNAKHTIK